MRILAATASVVEYVSGTRDGDGSIEEHTWTLEANRLLFARYLRRTGRISDYLALAPYWRDDLRRRLLEHAMRTRNEAPSYRWSDETEARA